MKDFLGKCGTVLRVEAVIVFWMTVVFGVSSLIAMLF